jgi:hypothetical protein
MLSFFVRSSFVKKNLLELHRSVENGFHSGSKSLKGFHDFFDPVDPNGKPGSYITTGRSWTAADLRRKSFDDLHKLWFVLYKERNLLLTARLTAKRFVKPVSANEENRYIKVKKSMGAIKKVLDERKKIDKLLKDNQGLESSSTTTEVST